MFNGKQVLRWRFPYRRIIGMERSRIEKKEKLKSNTVQTKALINPMGTLDLGWPFRVALNSGREIRFWTPTLSRYWILSFFLEEAIPLEEVTFLDQGFNLERSSTVLSAASTPGSWGNELMGRSGGYSTALATDTITVFILFFAFVLCLDSGDQKVVCFTLPSIVSCL